MIHTNTPPTNQVIASSKPFGVGDASSPAENGRQAALVAREGVSCHAARQSSDQAHDGSRENYTHNFTRLKANSLIDEVEKTQKRITTNKRIAQCCDLPAHCLNASIVERADGSVNIEGLARCENSVCINCGRVRAKEHAAKIGRILKNAQEAGHRVLFGTFGLNSRDNRLDLKTAYKSLLSTYQRTFRKRFIEGVGILGHIRSLDFTIKPNGDVNFHFHSLFVLAAGVDTPVDELYGVIYQRWADQAARFEQKTSYSGNDLREIQGADGISQYMAKAFNPLELVSREKTSLHSWTLVDLLAVIASDEGTKRHIAIYRALERALYRTRQIAYTKSLAIFDVEDDEEAEEEQSEVVSKLELPRNVWMIFRTVRTNIVSAWLVNGMAREYLTTLVDLVWENHVIFSDEELVEHRQVFMMACERDLKRYAANYRGYKPGLNPKQARV